MRVLAAVIIIAMSILSGLASAEGPLDGRSNSLLIGEAAYGDWRSDTPGTRRHIGASDLPAPYATRSVANSVMVVEQPGGARLKAPLGFQVKRFASGLQPRLIRVAPNGDIFIAESGAGRIRVLRPSSNGEEASRNEIFASGLRLPFGIAFFPKGMSRPLLK
jgi:glucose/arabinose dehydrogenase